MLEEWRFKGFPRQVQASSFNIKIQKSDLLGKIVKSDSTSKDLYVISQLSPQRIDTSEADASKLTKKKRKKAHKAMSSFPHLASPAPLVEAAKASPAPEDTDALNIQPAQPSEDASAQPAVPVGAAVTYDHSKTFAPPISPDKASYLSVAELRAESGADFESKVSKVPVDPFLLMLCTFNNYRS